MLWDICVVPKYLPDDLPGSLAELENLHAANAREPAASATRAAWTAGRWVALDSQPPPTPATWPTSTLATSTKQSSSAPADHTE